MRAYEGAGGLPLLRGLPADMVFTAGTVDTRTRAITVYFAPIEGECHGETLIQSTLPNLTIHSPCYGSCDSDYVYALDTYTDAGSYGFDKYFVLNVEYDGSGGPAEGQLRFLTRVTTGTCCGDLCDYVNREIGAINVHIEPAVWSASSNFQAHRISPVQHLFYISNPFLDGHPDALPIVTPIQVNSLYGQMTTCSGSPIGVWYDRFRSQWSIYNEDFAPMDDNTETFNVSFSGYKDIQRAFIHVTNAGNTSGMVSVINGPRLNSIPAEVKNDGNPYARIFVTHIFNPPGYASNYAPFKVGLFYSPSTRQWMIYREDLQNLPLGITYNVVVAAAPGNGVEIWPSEVNDTQAPLIQLTHVWRDPLTNNPGTYWDLVPVARTFWPWFGGAEWTVPGSYLSDAPTSLLYTRWVPVDAY